MTLVNRLLGDWSRRPFAIIQKTHMTGRSRPIAEVIKTLDDVLFVPGRREQGVIILTPGPLEAGTGFDLLVLGDSVAAAESLARETEIRLV